MEMRAPSTNQGWEVVSTEEIMRFHDYISEGEFTPQAALFGALFVMYTILHPASEDTNAEEWANGAHVFINREALRFALEMAVVPKEFGPPAGLAC